MTHPTPLLTGDELERRLFEKLSLFDSLVGPLYRSIVWDELTVLRRALAAARTRERSTTVLPRTESGLSLSVTLTRPGVAP